MISRTAGAVVIVAVLALRLFTPHAAADARALVVSSIRPVALLVAETAGDSVDSRLLLDAQSSPHDFALRPSDIRLLTEAQQVFWIGPALEVPLGELTVRFPGKIRHSPLMPAELSSDPAVDPHVWLDPELARAMAARIARVLVDEGLVAEGLLSARLEAFNTSLDTVESEIRDGFKGLDEVPFVVMHDAYGYFVRRFGLNQVAALAPDAEHAIGARSLAEMRRIAAESGAYCLFHEPAGSARLAAAVAEGTAMRVVELDPLARELAGGEHPYLQFLRQVAGTLADCLRNDPGPWVQ